MDELKKLKQEADEAHFAYMEYKNNCTVEADIEERVLMKKKQLAESSYTKALDRFIGE